ncbi:hypothetical protein L596_000055 [Steinernema carpocapsae]|uniref:Chitin-binding type-2 domain-containing protein n=2 Tax=Steinernema carpocapsae TaxID=34508 RepID=A0A4U8UJ33_STECR|nr:hypothetical protein L596_000055 [Steinernema carpocapsae]
MYFDDNTTWFDEVKECYPEYVQCFNGHSVLLRCPQDTVFDLTAKKCVPVPSCSANPNAIGELAMPSIVTCKDKAKGVHALQLCHKSHLLCDGKKNKPTILQCKYGYVFERGLCVLDSQCQRTVAEIVDESIATGASNSTFQGCQGQHDGFYEFSKCASSFVHCINEIGYKIACEERLVFKDGRCVWPDFCEFDRALINEEPTAAPVLRSLNSEPIPNLRVDCSRDGLFEIGRCQNQYLVCADAQPTLVKCLNKLVFYGHNRSCIELKGCLELEKAKMNLRSGMIKPMEKNVPPHADADEDQDHDHLVKWTSEGPPKEEIVEHPAPIPLVNKPVASLCEGKEDGKYVIEKCSRSYVSCENGTASVMNCPELLAYNGTNCSDSHACDLELSRAVKTISHTKPADTLPLGTSSIYQPKANSNSKRLIRQPKLGKGEYVPLLVPDYKCPTDGWFAEGYCLHFYIQCSNGYGYRFKCAANLVWSGHTCVWPRDCRTTKKQELEKHFFPGIEIVPDNENPFDKENKCATLNNCFLPTEKCGPSYIECVDRKTVYKTCPPGKIFKVETSSCEPPFYVVGCEPKKGAALPVPPPFCQGKLNGYHDIGGCSTQFYYCINGEGDEHSCQENLYYDYLTQKCQVKEHVVSCGGSRFVEPPKDHVHGKNKSLKVDRFCAGKANGYYGLNGCHNFYYDCQNQVTKKVKCPLKLFYDDEIGHCDLSYHIPVCGGTRPVSTISKPKVPPFCVNRKDGKYGDAGCNTYFYVCRNQETEKQHCQPGLVFDPDLEKCHLKEFVPCCGGVRPTKPLVAPRDPFCDHKHDGTYPGGECQSFYYRCTGQVTTKLACPNDQVYNPEISACARRERIPVCGGSRATAKPTEQPSEVDRFCYGKSYGTYAVSSCSAFFYQCQPGRSQKTPCPHNLAYNAETNKCERQEYVPSCKGIPPTLAPKDPQPPTENDSFCNNKPDGSYAANKCAPFFYQCSSGRSTKTPCLYELVYDAEMDRCGKKEHIPSCGGVRPPTQTTPVNPLPLHVYDPFCVAKANGTYPVGTCSNLYYECFDGYTWKMPCAVGLFFDAEIVKCDHKEHIPSCGGIRPTIPPPVPTRPYDSFCENKPNGTYPVNKCAPVFYECLVGIANRMPCPTGLFYDAEIDKCGQKEHIPSCGGTRPVTNPPHPLFPQSYDPFCETKVDGTYPVDMCSNKYYECFDRQAWKMSCPEGLYFDVGVIQCRYQQHVPSCGGIRPDPVKPTDPVPTRPYDPFCENKVDGNHAMDNCAHFFYQCQGGVANRMPCPLGLVYDAEIHKCDHRKNVPSCGGNRPVTQPPQKDPLPPVRPDHYCQNRQDGSYEVGRCSHYYYRCITGFSHKINCSRGLFYDAEIDKCTIKEHNPSCGGSRPVTTHHPEDSFPPVDNFCRNKRNGTYPAGDCASFYYQCSQGTLYKKYCRNGEVFDTQQKQCYQKQYVRGCGVLPTSAPTNYCYGKADGDYFYTAQKCASTFYRCLNQRTHKMMCRKGSFYDLSIKKCDIPQNVPDCSGRRPVVESKDPIVPPNVNFCREKQDRLYPTGPCSDLYYGCSYGQATRYSCPESLFFDPEMLNCYPRSIIRSCKGTHPDTEKGRIVRQTWLPVRLVKCRADKASETPCPVGWRVNQVTKQCADKEEIPECRNEMKPKDPASANEADIFCRGKTEGEHEPTECKEFHFVCSKMGNKKIPCMIGYFRDAEFQRCGIREQIPACGGQRPTVAPSKDLFCVGREDGYYPAYPCGSSYNHCNDQKLIVITCPKGLLYDHELGNCHPKLFVPGCGGQRPKPEDPRPPTQAPRPPPTQPSHPDQVFCVGKLNGVYPCGQCQRFYYECSNSNTTKRECPPGLYFDNDQNLCERKKLITECGGSPYTKQPKPVTPPMPPTKAPVRHVPNFDCSEKATGDYSGGCSNAYFSCVGGYKYVRFCAAPGLRFSQEAHRCDYPENVPECGGKPPKKEPAKPQPEVQTNPPSPVTTNKPQPPGRLEPETPVQPNHPAPPGSHHPVCQGKLDGISYGSAICHSSYYSCLSGSPINHFCPTGEAFNEHSGQCQNRSEHPYCPEHRHPLGEINNGYGGK